ncbi:YbaB/EbfC family nucleoid-associated protein [Actinomadura gamaensis]|uniref:YbaB/EbfC family nucleoid-associated protein n=1 Tax=Actinomadura gamaensis TaxID=1763541 RepID=A0ABV9UC70_9ACTN
MAKLGAVREEMAGLTGRGESPDGHVVVEATGEDPLARLTIDPRAMRMAAEDLAAAVTDAARRARADLDAQVSRITEREYGENPNPMDALRDKEAVQKQLKDMQAYMEQAGRNAQTMVDQIYRNLGMRQSGQ